MVEAGEDVLSGVVRRQEAALRRLEQKHGPGYGQPPPGSQSEQRARRYNENCVRWLARVVYWVDHERTIFFLYT